MTFSIAKNNLFTIKSNDTTIFHAKLYTGKVLFQFKFLTIQPYKINDSITKLIDINNPNNNTNMPLQFLKMSRVVCELLLNKDYPTKPFASKWHLDIPKPKFVFALDLIFSTLPSELNKNLGVV